MYSMLRNISSNLFSRLVQQYTQGIALDELWFLELIRLKVTLKFNNLCFFFLSASRSRFFISKTSFLTMLTFFWTEIFVGYLRFYPGSFSTIRVIAIISFSFDILKLFVKSLILIIKFVINKVYVYLWKIRMIWQWRIHCFINWLVHFWFRFSFIWERIWIESRI